MGVDISNAPDAFRSKIRCDHKFIDSNNCAKCGAVGTLVVPAVGGTRPDIAPAMSKDERGLNKLERAYLHQLRRLGVPLLNIQAITLKLADDCRLTADFTFMDPNGRLVFADVKGFQREDALIKMKVAARKFPEFRFTIVTRERGVFVEKEVSP